MRKLAFVICMLVLSLAIQVPVAAQEDQPTSEVATEVQEKPISFISENEAVITFYDLNFEEAILQSPYDLTTLRFSTPPNWTLRPKSEIVLEYDVLFSGNDIVLLGDQIRNYAGELSVSLNDQVIGTIYLVDDGTQTTTIEITEDAYLPTRTDGRHQLEIFLNAEISCDYDIRTVVVLKDVSYISLQFDTTPPALNLANLPFPFYQRDAVVQENTLFVLPNNPDPGVLQAALNVVSGFGSMTRSDFVLDVVTEKELSPEVLGTSNLVFIGQPGDFSLTQDVAFSLPVVGEKFSGIDDEAANDGILQMAHSPWNGDKAVLFVTGNTPEAVNKAAQAISTGDIFVYNDPTIVYVADVQSVYNKIAAVEDFTLAGLGYDTLTMSGLGYMGEEYLFYLEKEQVGAEDGYIDLMYYHSGVLNYDSSSMVVRLNGEVIASQIFAGESVRLSTLRIDIPKGILRFGENRLEIAGNLVPYDVCSLMFAEYYLTIVNGTSFHIPVTPLSDENQQPWADLQLFPQAFVKQSDLGNVAFVLPKNSSASWQNAMKMAYSLGGTANPLVSNLSMAYADDIPDNMKAGMDLIIIGKASNHPLLSEINQVLPAPFDFDTDTASEKQMQIIYRLPPGVDVGYLETLISPLDNNQVMLIVSGNSDMGIDMAGNTLVDSSLRSQLAGQFAVTNGSQVKTSQVMTPVGMPVAQSSIVGEMLGDIEVTEEMKTVAIDVPDLSVPNQKLAQPVWLSPLITVSIISIAVILLFALISGIRRSRSSVK